MYSLAEGIFECDDAEKEGVATAAPEIDSEQAVDEGAEKCNLFEVADGRAGRLNGCKANNNRNAEHGSITAVKTAWKKLLPFGGRPPPEESLYLPGCLIQARLVVCPKGINM